ncbi:hypothetical protein ROZALSC1DRAFT_27402 [Rozella allomycis CSF55]|uniref:Myb-like domain-containing protein n=1 Tax=Rozella allomycis (strain CSF55) TaxID=988480 RepID=A0A075AQ26_ROZAC|nr:hypothetical protein O9G_002582 [Rozella allomycis CSF55]RKP21177.1 hypothetical protein ROZALSC1DRAFT_27402 [Rozella allomycis CSF55]|eukprot:EPZ32230.1 hypothetical protein O9G_002582 [Rozella allomycis CSF55]
MFTTAFKFSPSLLIKGRWLPDEKEKLLSIYEKYGPAWPIFERFLKGRRAKHCRYFIRFRHMKPPTNNKRELGLYQMGCELINNKWYYVPEVPIPKRYVDILYLKTRPNYLTGVKIRRLGFEDTELRLLIEAYEEFGSNWRRIKYLLKGRDEEFCYEMLRQRSMDFYSINYYEDNKERLVSEMNEHQAKYKDVM